MLCPLANPSHSFLLMFGIFVLSLAESYHTNHEIENFPLAFAPSSRSLRSAYAIDSVNQDSKPELTARHEQNYTQLNCTVKSPREHDVFINCPALGNLQLTGPCYQGCIPTNPCERNSELQTSCVPNEQSVFCHKSQFSNGTIVLLLKIARTDPRLVGAWSCTHASFESAKFEIVYERAAPLTDSKPEESSLNPTSSSASKSIHAIEKSHASTGNLLDERTLSYLRSPAVIISVLSVLSISILINLVFCIRCLLMRSYVDACHEGSNSANCLGACLCIPKKKRTASLIRTTPLLPRSNWGTGTNLNGSYQGSAHLVYQPANLQKFPILIGQQSQNDLSGVSYYPTGSLPGTFRKHSQTRLGSGTPQTDMMGNPQLSYQPVNEAAIPLLQQNNLQTLNELGLGTNYIPSYFHVPSVNAPSPSSSHRLLSLNHTSGIYQSPNTTLPISTIPGSIDGQPPQQYLLRMQPALIGGHVVYDDVAAGNSSIVGNHNRSPQGSTVDNPAAIIHLPQWYQARLPATANASETGPPLGSPQFSGLPCPQTPPSNRQTDQLTMKSIAPVLPPLNTANLKSLRPINSNSQLPRPKDDIPDASTTEVEPSFESMKKWNTGKEFGIKETSTPKSTVVNGTSG